MTPHVPAKPMTRKASAAKAKPATWQGLSPAEQGEALMLIHGEQIMWRSGRGTNWHASSLHIVKMRHRVLGLAIKALRQLARGKRP